jgi:hypothetical protein
MEIHIEVHAGIHVEIHSGIHVEVHIKIFLTDGLN